MYLVKKSIMEKTLINLPQLNFNLFVFITCLIAIGFGKYYESYTLYWFGFTGALVSLTSLIVCLWWYTIHYCNVTKDISKHKLKKFKDLLDSGAITEAEYNTQKAKILNS